MNQLGTSNSWDQSALCADVYSSDIARSDTSKSEGVTPVLGEQETGGEEEEEYGENECYLEVNDEWRKRILATMQRKKKARKEYFKANM
jgi:hypothetical protein